MRNAAKDLISKYGQTIEITPSENISPETATAFIQPLRSDEQSSLYGDYLDSSQKEQFLYIGLPEYKLSTYPAGTIIMFRGEKYTIKKAESVYISNEAIYERAVLEKETS